MREHTLFRIWGHRLLEPELWHLHRRSVGGAFFIGLFCAFLPIPTQMLAAASMALIGRCNIALSVAITWVTNPLTMGPMFFFAYKLGAWLLDTQVTITTVELSWAWLSNQIGQIWWPLLVGCLICGIIGNVGFPNTLETARRSTLETAPSKTPKQDRFLILLARMQLLCRIRSGRQ